MIHQSLGIKRASCCVLMIAALLLCANATAEQSTLQPNFTELARTGHFDQLLQQLNHSYHNTQYPAVTDLIEQLRRQQNHQQVHRDERRKNYNKAIAQAAEYYEADRIEDALISVIDAHSHCDVPDIVIKLQLVRAVVEDAESQAIKAEKDGDWLKAQSLYRLLELLYDDRSDYRDMRQRASNHVRALRLYAPSRYVKLQRDQAIRRGKTEDEIPHTTPENWQDNVEDANSRMLRQSISRACNFYVGSTDYQQLLFGAIDNLLTLININGASESFPTLSDTENTEKMQQFLLGLRGIVSRQPEISYKQALTTVDSIVLMNGKTINLPESVIYYELTEGAIGQLDDFSSVIWPSDQERFNRTIEGKYYGVGIHIQMKDQRLTVISPIANSPAQRAGIRTNDVIVTVDGRDCTSWSLNQAVREITGEANTPVILGIERPGVHEIIPITLNREEILIESVLGFTRDDQQNWDFYIDRTNRIGYIRVTQFIKQTSDDLDAAINQLESRDGLNGLIIDLRFNPGGLLRSAIEISDRFVTEGPLASTVDAMGRKTSEYRAQPQKTIRDIPLVVLINQGSASASEIVAGALQDYDRAWIVGQRSYGKGSVQDPFVINNHPMAFLKLTTQYYALPKGRIIHRHPDATDWGIEPDLSVDMTEMQVANSIEFRRKADIIRSDDPEANTDQPPVTAEQIISEGIDPQLEAALLILKTQLVTKNLEIARAE